MDRRLACVEGASIEDMEAKGGPGHWILTEEGLVWQQYILWAPFDTVRFLFASFCFRHADLRDRRQQD